MAMYCLSFVAFSLNSAYSLADILAGARSKQDEDVAVRDQEADVTEDRSTLKSDETDDDNEILSSYRSAF